ncbi:MAG TPA: hypothetical protein QF571_12415 [Desulfobacterales bacterium]|jgi:hypothetical protein|nr:hypothetical protein [Desulfobacterales bacterium]
MKASAKVDAGICGFKARITADTEDGMNVELLIGSNCDTIKELAQLIRAKNPFNAIQDLAGTTESAVLSICRPILQKKGCCEACVVPVAMCKTMQVATNLALPKDVVIELSKA